MKKPQIIFLSIIAFIVVGGFILFKTLFSGNGSNNNELFQQLVASKDSLIKSEREKIYIYEQVIEEKQRTYEALSNRDSILNSHYAEGELNYKKINETIKNIPNRITVLRNNPDSIARAFADF